jgi:hypothetical protein
MGIIDRPEAMSLAHQGLTGAAWRTLDAARRKQLLSCAIAGTEAVNWACAIDEQLRKDPDYEGRRDQDEEGRVLSGLRYVRDKAMHHVVIAAARDVRSFFKPRPGGVIHIGSSYPIWAPTDALPESTGRHKHPERKAAYDQYVAERGAWKPVFAALRFLTRELDGKVPVTSIDEPGWYVELSPAESAAISNGPMLYA